MTTVITEGELKIVYIALAISAIIGIFMFLYVQQPIQASFGDMSQATAENNTVTSDSSTFGWINGIISSDMGFGRFLPNGAVDIIIVSTIFLGPLIAMLAIIVIRLIKDIATGWI